jgi:dTMP kinase
MSLFITFEGPEGCGKTTQARRLAASLEALGQPVRLTREPGGAPIAEQVRAVLLAPENHAMLPATELFLYLAARAQHTAEVIRPALAAGVTVLCDRYSDSTLAYQGFGHGLPLAEVERMDAFATGSLRPDLTIYLDVPVEVGLARKRGAEWNRLEAQTVAFHARVRAGYHALVERAPERYLALDGQRPADELAEAILAAVRARLSRPPAAGREQ